MTRVEIPPGRHKVADGVEFDVRLLDPGVVLSLFDTHVNRRYTICIDEHGVVTYQAVVAIDPNMDQAVLQPAVVLPQVVAPLPEQSPSSRRPSRIRVFIRYRDGRRTQTAWLYGGYRCDPHLVLLYRTRGRGGTQEDLLRVIGKEFRVLGAAMRQEAKINVEDWDTFLGLPDNADFNLGGRRWTKLPMAELQVLNGVTLRPIPVIGEERDLGY